MDFEKFHLENITVNVSADHRFGTDAFLLAAFAKPQPKDIVCDLCTGCGIIPLIFCRSKPPARIYGVELQEEAVGLFRASVEENGLDGRVFPVHADLTRELPIARESVNMVTVNPPYFRENSGKTKLSEAQKIARHEIACKLSDVIGAADYLLKYGGTLKMCHLPERLADIFALMRAAKIEPKVLTPVCNKIGEKPWLCLVSGKKGGKVGLDITKPLIMRNESGFTEELLGVYGMQKQ